MNHDRWMHKITTALRSLREAGRPKAEEMQACRSLRDASVTGTEDGAGAPVGTA